MAQEDPGQEPIGEDARIASLQQRIARAERQEQVRVGKTDEKADENNRLGNRVFAELIGGPAGGAIVGGFLDYLFGTGPWLLLAFLFLGIIVAFRNIIRISTQRPEQ